MNKLIRLKKENETARILRLYEIAANKLGGNKEINRWLKTPNRHLNGVAPINHLKTPIEYNMVEELLQ